MKNVFHITIINQVEQVVGLMPVTNLFSCCEDVKGLHPVGGSIVLLHAIKACLTWAKLSS